MKKNIILFGPPGMGKSTLIGILKTLGQRAIDLEDISTTRQRSIVLNYISGCYVGGADLNPARMYPNALKVLLVASQETYEARREQRDAVNPGKATQKHHSVSAWMKNATYDLILRTDRQTPSDTAAVLITLGEKHE